MVRCGGYLYIFRLHLDSDKNMEVFIAFFLISILVVGAIWSLFMGYKKEQKSYDHFVSQEWKLRKWSAERFGPSEADIAKSLLPLNPFAAELDKDEKMRRYNAIKGLSSNWADTIINRDKINRERQTEHFKSWGIERFESSWSKTGVRLCRLVSANRTSSFDMLSDGEIEILNSYLIAETLGSVSSTVDTALVKTDDPDKPTRWTQLKCDNCGAPLLKGQCIYCNTAYAHE